MRYTKAITLGVMLTALAGTASVATAAEAGKAPAQGPASSAQADVSEAKLDKFADAYVAMVQVRTKYTQQLKQADKEQAREIQQQARKEMASAIESSGMSVQEYNRIGGAIQSDKGLQKRVMKKIQARQGQQ